MLGLSDEGAIVPSPQLLFWRRPCKCVEIRSNQPLTWKAFCKEYLRRYVQMRLFRERFRSPSHKPISSRPVASQLASKEARTERGVNLSPILFAFINIFFCWGVLPLHSLAYGPIALYTISSVKHDFVLHIGVVNCN